MVYCPDPSLTSVSTFQLDTAFDQLSTTEELFGVVVRPLVNAVARGQNAVCAVCGEDETAKSLLTEGRPGSSLAGPLHNGFREPL